MLGGNMITTPGKRVCTALATASLAVASVMLPAVADARAGFHFVGAPVLQLWPAQTRDGPVVTGGKPRPGITVGLVFRLNQAMPRYPNGSFDGGMKLDGQFSAGSVLGAFDVTSSPRGRNCYEDSVVIPVASAVVGRAYTVSYLLGSGHNSPASVTDPQPLTTKLYLHGLKSSAQVTQQLGALGCFAG
jgi:hypothetical protein